MKRLLAALVVALALALAAQAHVSTDTEVQSAALGDRFLYFSTQPGVLYAGEQGLALLSVSERDFRAAENLTVALEVRGAAVDASEASPGRYQAPIRFDAPGAHAVAWVFPSANGTETRWTVNVTAYPDLGVEVEPFDPLADYYENGTYEMGLVVLNRTTGAPDPRVDDLRVSFEHWTDDHKTLLGTDYEEAEPRDGAWWATYTFREKGMYHVYVASQSLGLDFRDTPYVHLYAANALPSSPEPERDAPGSVVGAVAVLAVGGLLARRRQG